MPRSQCAQTERGLQPRFNKRAALALVSLGALGATIVGAHYRARGQPMRAAHPDRVVVGSAVELDLLPAARAQRVAMRWWRVTAPDSRLGGVSGLAVDGRDLVALSDEGAVIRFAAPTVPRQALRMALHDLPAVPGAPGSKAGRDSEALLAAPSGGWWIAFEGRHALWRFDPGFGGVVERHPLAVKWPRNKGGEAIALAGDGAVMVLPESGGRAVAVGGRGEALTVPHGTADATRLPDGRLALVTRRFTYVGFQSEIRIAAGSGGKALRMALPIGALDNPEALAAAPLPDGGTRLWIATDDNYRPWMRTVLIALDLPAA